MVFTRLLKMNARVVIFYSFESVQKKSTRKDYLLLKVESQSHYIFIALKVFGKKRYKENYLLKVKSQRHIFLSP